MAKWSHDKRYFNILRRRMALLLSLFAYQLSPPAVIMAGYFLQVENKNTLHTAFPFIWLPTSLRHVREHAIETRQHSKIKLLVVKTPQVQVPVQQVVPWRIFGLRFGILIVAKADCAQPRHIHLPSFLDGKVWEIICLLPKTWSQHSTIATHTVAPTGRE